MSRIIQLSDLHVLPAPQRVSGVLNTHALLVDTIDTPLADWHKIGPIDAVVVIGDITDTSDAQSYQLFRQQIQRLPAPYFLIPSNHDRRDTMRLCFEDNATIPPSGKIN